MISDFKRLGFANIDCKASILVKGYSENESINIGCYGYYFKLNGRNIIVDTGIEDIDTVNLTKSSRDDWKRGEGEMSVSDNLAKIGVRPEDIDEVYITHSHYDHISGVCNFANANIYISRDEYDYLRLPSNPHNRFLGDVIDFLDSKDKEGKLVLVDKEYSNDGITLKVVGGHTVGSMLVFADELLFTGDSIFLLESIENNAPIGFSNDEKGSLSALEICVNHKGTVLTGHDKAQSHER